MKKKKNDVDPWKFDGLILTRNLSKKELDKVKDELAEARARIQSGLTHKDRLTAKILQFKLKLKDYLTNDDFDPNMSFGACLVQYVEMLEMKRKVLAEQIDIDETELSQVINKHRPPAEYLFIRLEIHSNNNIPAGWWYRLMEKEKEYRITTNKGLRNQQKKHVRKKLDVRV